MLSPIAKSRMKHIFHISKAAPSGFANDAAIVGHPVRHDLRENGEHAAR